MKVQELVNKINDDNFDLEKELEIKKYLPIDVKKTIAQSIIYECASEENGAVQIDSVQKYLSYMRYMITTHTSLEYTDEDYDALCSTAVNGKPLRDVIIRYFDDDATECKRILNYMANDYLKENSLEFALIGFVSNLNVKLAGLAEMISGKIEGLDLNEIMPKDVDMDKINVFLNKYIK